ncbi:LCP family protein [Arcanobacterium hippocoleae]|uniref:LCP family protein n=1 Tax=Arcanobacterium hippocoleae TaxID=149017 RepID=UPI0033425469
MNAAFALGGAPLLVKTVEQLSGLTIDHYVEIGMDGVIALTDAVGGINLCYDHDAADQYSGLIWTAGCHDVDGKTALAFSRMRYQDPQGDIGRAKRQRQVVSKILAKAVSKETFLNPARQKRLVGAGAEILTVDQSDSLWDVGMSAFALKDATSKGGVTGTPPISSLNYHAAGIGGSAVLLDQSLLAAFWEDFRNGTLSPDKYETIHASE